MSDEPEDVFDRWPNLDALLSRALETPSEDRMAFLEDACGGDRDLQEELQHLLAADAASERFLEDSAPWFGGGRPSGRLATTADLGSTYRDHVAQALAARYAIQRELGSGGMATVFLAEDRKHHRPVAVKVLRLQSMIPRGSDRFLREIEIAANLRHPHILPLFDSGNAGGLLYYVMPYVEGETLHDRLMRERPFPIEDAVNIAAEVADALSYAHSRGVVHRDIKPANILLESDHALVADFGVAKAIRAAGDDQLTQTGMSLGTPAYMSPEQVGDAGELDGRSDIYSLGCVLFEMLTGELPHTGSTPQTIVARKAVDPVPSVRVLRGTVPEAVEEAVSRALATVPADRVATAAEFRDALRHRDVSGVVGARRRPSRLRRRVAAVAAAILTAVVGIIGFNLSSPTSIPLDQRDWVLVSDVANRTGDSVFDGSVQTALTIGLRQSRQVNLFPRTRVFQTLQRMQRDGDGPIDEELALEIARREDVRLVLVPSIEFVDPVYLMTARILDPNTGLDLASRSERARGKDDVLPALDRLVRRLRRDLGESRRVVAGNQERLFPLTTRSLEALQAWTRGERHWRAGQFQEAVTLWKRAVAIDSNFAQAHQSLGLYYYNVNLRPSGDLHFDKALALVDSVSERERFWIQATIASIRNDLDEAVSAYNVLLAQYPNLTSAWYNLGNTYRRLFRDAEAQSAYRRVLELDSVHANAMINLATSFNQAGGFDSALVYYRRAFDQRPRMLVTGNVNHEYGFAYAKVGDLESAKEVFSQMLTGSPVQQAWGHRSLGMLRMLEGKYDSAVSHLSEAIALNRSLNHGLSAYRNLLYRAASYRAKGMGIRFERDLDAATVFANEPRVSPDWLSVLATFRARRGEREEVVRLIDSMVVRANDDNRLDQAAVALIRGELARLEGRPSDADEQFDMAYALRPWAYAAEARADHYVGTGRVVEAIEIYRTIVDDASPPLGFEGQEPWVQAHYHLARLSEQIGDTSAAIDRYGRLLERWQHADRDLPALIDARERMERLVARRPRD